MARDGFYGLTETNASAEYHSVHSVINKFPKTDK